MNMKVCALLKGLQLVRIILQLMILINAKNIILAVIQAMYLIAPVNRNVIDGKIHINTTVINLKINGILYTNLKIDLSDTMQFQMQFERIQTDF